MFIWYNAILNVVIVFIGLTLIEVINRKGWFKKK